MIPRRAHGPFPEWPAYLPDAAEPRCLYCTPGVDANGYFLEDGGVVRVLWCLGWSRGDIRAHIGMAHTWSGFGLPWPEYYHPRHQARRLIRAVRNNTYDLITEYVGEKRAAEVAYKLSAVASWRTCPCGILFFGGLQFCSPECKRSERMTIAGAALRRLKGRLENDRKRRPGATDSLHSERTRCGEDGSERSGTERASTSNRVEGVADGDRARTDYKQTAERKRRTARVQKIELNASAETSVWLSPGPAVSASKAVDE